MIDCLYKPTASTIGEFCLDEWVHWFSQRKIFSFPHVGFFRGCEASALECESSLNIFFSSSINSFICLLCMLCGWGSILDIKVSEIAAKNLISTSQPLSTHTTTSTKPAPNSPKKYHHLNKPSSSTHNHAICYSNHNLLLTLAPPLKQDLLQP